MAESSVADAGPLGNAIARLRSRMSAPFFLQVGGFDGESFDPLRASVLTHNLSGLIVEPIPKYFEKLQTLYAGSETVLTANYAVAEEDGTRTLWRFNPEAVERGLLLPHFAGISSFVMEDLLSETGVLGRSSPNPETTAILRRLVEAVPVECRTFDSLLREFGIPRVDILQIDTEGYDFEILKMFDLGRYRPAIVQYEHQHLNEADAAAARDLLSSHGYRLTVQQYDTLAERDPASVQADIAALQKIAASLVDAGQARQALPLLEHLHALVPEDLAIMQLLAIAQSADDRVLEAMNTVTLLQVHTENEALTALAQTLKLRGFEIFNAHVAANRLQQAERYAAGLAALLPDHPQIQDAAFRVNRVLGRLRRATDYAIATRTLDNNNRLAWDFLSGLRADPATAALEIERRVTRALSPRPGIHPLYILRDLHYAASAILCEPLTPARRVPLEHILKTALTMGVPVDPKTKWFLWERFYRLILSGVDLAAVDAPTPESDEAPVSFVNVEGVEMDWAAVRATADRQKARIVFFAAGDEVYVRKFARWYALSILKHVDVPCLVVVHVIGAGNRLGDIARSLHIADERVVFAGDDFDASAVTTVCYDAPNHGINQKPVAHFQSVRFQRLAALLTRLERPVCVSDIDLLLQRGIADMLDEHAADDVVINDNLAGLSVADRVTANLLLVRPTDAGLRFARFVGVYLTRVLASAAVMRWIDQLALLMGRHHLEQAGLGRIGVFDPARDINNVMYTAYKQNPYRFLSLYQGFDTESLAAFAAETGIDGALAS